MLGQDTSDRRAEKPPVLWPVPLTEAPAMVGDVSGVDDLIGERIVISSPVDGVWYYDMRLMTAPHTRGDDRVVGVLPEIDWYRQQRDQTYIAVPRSVPVDRVWHEIETEMPDSSAPASLPQDDIPENSRAAHLVPSIDSPPVRWPRKSAVVTGSLTGARCWIGGHRGYRIGCEPYRQEAEGRLHFWGGLDQLDRPVFTTCVRLLDEETWYKALDHGGDFDNGVYQVETSIVWLE